MTLVKFVDADGTQTDVEINDGISVMEGAVRAGIDGIDADCGGQLSCATCHVYVDDRWAAMLPQVSDDEDALLEFAVDRQPNSRLSCQIPVSSELAGLVIHVPPRQTA